MPPETCRLTANIVQQLALTTAKLILPTEALVRTSTTEEFTKMHNYNEGIEECF
jgi:hypothetical protein